MVVTSGDQRDAASTVAMVDLVPGTWVYVGTPPHRDLPSSVIDTGVGQVRLDTVGRRPTRADVEAVDRLVEVGRAYRAAAVRWLR